MGIEVERRLRIIPGAEVNGLLTGALAETEFDPAAVAAMTKQLAGWSSPAEVFSAAIAAAGLASGAQAGEFLDSCRATGKLEEAIFLDQSLIARAHVIPGSGLGQATVPVLNNAPYNWVRALNSVPEKAGWLLASPLAIGQVWLDGAVLPTIPDGGWIPDGSLQEALAEILLLSGLLLSYAEPRDKLALSSDALRIHAQSRRGSARGPVGATGPEPTPSAFPAGEIALRVPDILPELPFATVLRARQSHRSSETRYDPPDAEMFAALLWIALRDRMEGPSRHGARISRPYPGAGGWHALDAYIAFTDPPTGLPAFSRYDAARHALTALSGSPGTLLRGAGEAMGTPPPLAMIILAARFAGLGARYGDAAYPLILKEAGGAVQTLHLTATALGWGSCWLGGGNSRDFARITGLDPLEHGPVAEMALTGPLADIKRSDAR